MRTEIISTEENDMAEQQIYNKVKNTMYSNIIKVVSLNTSINLKKILNLYNCSTSRLIYNKITLKPISTLNRLIKISKDGNTNNNILEFGESSLTLIDAVRLSTNNGFSQMIFIQTNNIIFKGLSKDELLIVNKYYDNNINEYYNDPHYTYAGLIAWLKSKILIEIQNNCDCANNDQQMTSIFDNLN